MNDRYEKIVTTAVLLTPLLFAIKGGYLQEVAGYLYLYLIQGYVAWFLYFKCGQPFFGYSVTMAIGAYGAIILKVMAHWPLFGAIMVSAVVASAVSVIIFIATIRARGFYVSMASFLLAILFPRLIEALRDITGGRSGLYFTGMSDFMSDKSIFVVVILLTAVVATAFFWLMDTKTGKIFTLISENDRLTQAVGINTRNYKLLAYTIAGFISGIGGAMYVNYTGFVSSVDIEVFTTVYIFFIPLIGGNRLFYGPILGALFVILLPELLVSIERYLRIVYGLIFIIVIVFLPEGLAPYFRNFIRRVFARRLS